MKCNLIKIYQVKRGGSLFIRATKGTETKFKLKGDEHGKALSKNVSNEEIGRAIREILKNCE